MVEKSNNIYDRLKIGGDTVESLGLDYGNPRHCFDIMNFAVIATTREGIPLPASPQYRGLQECE